MGKNTGAKYSAHAPNPKRTAAKLARGFGMAAMEKMHANEQEWSKKNDITFGVKGVERWMLLKTIK